MANCYVHHTVENSNMSVIKNNVLCLEKYIPVFCFFFFKQCTLRIFSPTTDTIFIPGAKTQILISFLSLPWGFSQLIPTNVNNNVLCSSPCPAMEE